MNTEIHGNIRKKSLKIPKEYSNQKRKWGKNTMDERKITKGQTMIYTTLYRKIKIKQHELH